ncbi:MAG TPA: DUF6483 family protein [Thermomicrobiaceae bacterium]|nr:DUF6483 family protein [Thermomicrobiaceae bacterium]
MQRDYILRLIEELGSFLKTVFELRRRGQYQQAERLIDDQMMRMVGFGMTVADQFPAPTLVGMVRLGNVEERDQRMVAERMVVLGSLLQEGAEVDGDLGNERRRDERRIKALHVFLIALTEEPTAPRRAVASVDRLLEELAEFDLPADAKERLWQHFQQEGQFARAEDWLYELLEDDRAPDDTLERGLAFYQRLSALSDDVLAAGNLPRDEVLAGLAQLQERARERGE